MTAKETLDAANDGTRGERFRRYERGPRGACRREGSVLVSGSIADRFCALMILNDANDAHGSSAE
jgi:hypothetical protein